MLVKFNAQIIGLQTSKDSNGDLMQQAWGTCKKGEEQEEDLFAQWSSGQHTLSEAVPMACETEVGWKLVGLDKVMLG